jgi:hypothetical protein
MTAGAPPPDSGRRRPFPLRGILVAAALLFGTAAFGRAQAHAENDLPGVEATTVPGAIRVDGVLDEPAWRESGVIANLT